MCFFSKMAKYYEKYPKNVVFSKNCKICEKILLNKSKKAKKNADF